MVLSEDPLTTSLSLYWRQAMPRLWPLSVRTNSHVLVLHTCKHSKKVFHLHHHTTATNHPSLNPRPPTDHSRPAHFYGSVSRRRHDVFVVKVHHVDGGAVTHEHTAQADVGRRRHVPHRDGAIFRTRHHETVPEA